MKLLLALSGLLAGVCRGEQASESLQISVTIPVTIPLQVPAGISFRQAAEEFCTRNNLDAANIEPIETAVAERWQEMQKENMIRNQCTSWQLMYGVFPAKDWGTLPENYRVKWLKDECDSYVPEQPPKALYTLDINVDETVLALRAFDGDTVRSSVERFCLAHGIDFEQNGPTLIQALQERVEKGLVDEPEKPVLFSVPFQINDKVVRLRVHQGDDINTLVTTFCDTHGIDKNTYGQQISQAIIDTTKVVQGQLEDELKAKQAIEEKTQPKLLLDIPINVNGADVSMKLYDGDYVNEKITQFCQAHGLDETQDGAKLLAHITERTQALSQTT
mmetsp:Transcript_26227/g.42479  ORF Transcript_26227/g.42479 Transcript_26227/m.42479 type:complete len:332 (-) Transcript_26227:1170-2165(-)|eukprot:CAMPEP_0203749596 /NCGR_PEP_ID=MMETSP0098-20131031/4093_1 /ASSEMBLY_ACC=CAM_ASM_000208 /TAXON_ID=96639 /ORGANISM=" , Strain NY0313808BC1" /LENGTH=331 /DNA_ID=CAMNT_0050638675 /DNA_START=119 /DNA_END=1114 /DNA_ORIENTATION=-